MSLIRSYSNRKAFIGSEIALLAGTAAAATASTIQSDTTIVNDNIGARIEGTHFMEPALCPVSGNGGGDFGRCVAASNGCLRMETLNREIRLIFASRFFILGFGTKIK